MCTNRQSKAIFSSNSGSIPNRVPQVDPLRHEVDAVDPVEVAQRDGREVDGALVVELRPGVERVAVVVEDDGDEALQGQAEEDGEHQQPVQGARPGGGVPRLHARVQYRCGNSPKNLKCFLVKSRRACLVYSCDGGGPGEVLHRGPDDAAQAHDDDGFPPKRALLKFHEVPHFLSCLLGVAKLFLLGNAVLYGRPPLRRQYLYSFLAMVVLTKSKQRSVGIRAMTAFGRY